MRANRYFKKKTYPFSSIVQTYISRKFPSCSNLTALLLVHHIFFIVASGPLDWDFKCLVPHGLIDIFKKKLTPFLPLYRLTFPEKFPSCSNLTALLLVHHIFFIVASGPLDWDFKCLVPYRLIDIFKKKTYPSSSLLPLLTKSNPPDCPDLKGVYQNCVL